MKFMMGDEENLFAHTEVMPEKALLAFCDHIPYLYVLHVLHRPLLSCVCSPHVTMRTLFLLTVRLAAARYYMSRSRDMRQFGSTKISANTIFLIHLKYLRKSGSKTPDPWTVTELANYKVVPTIISR
ncbi:hypothetical protein B566_EDAN013893 [Ephemera danica]|nr:hypothetical protein B566_EDAN013893 [Ephemera danica]